MRPRITAGAYSRCAKRRHGCSVPGPQGPSGAAAGTFAELSDVDVSALGDGALIQYNGNTQKFEVTQTIETNTGSIRLNGGVF